MSKVERFKSTRLVHKNPVVAVVRMADEDFLAGGQGAEDVDATSCLAFVSLAAEFICMGVKLERESRCRNKQHEEKRP
jgi:hypothetical protein